MNLNATLFGEMITFGIFVWFTLKYVVPPIQGIVDERQAMAQKTQANFDSSEASLRDSEKSGQEIIAKAVTKANQQESDVDARCKDMIRTAEIAAREKAAKIAEDQEKYLKQSEEKLHADFKIVMADMVADALESVLTKKLTPEFNTKLVDQLITEEE
jgi:F-type H+-transporting ATPase subunit b